MARQAYTISLDVDMGTVPQGLSLNIQGSQNNPYPLVAGTNTFTFDAWFPTPGMDAILFVRADGAPFPVDYKFSFDNVAISQVNTVTVNKINHVADYFPYGKIVRKFVEGDEERFLTTQHERDEETGLDYRGARYYDSEIGRFLSLDPLAKDYPSLSDYSYVAGNPVVFIDTDVKRFIVPRESQREQVLGMLNKYSQHTYATNDKGEIYVKEWNTNENGSEYFSDRMQQAINSDKLTEIVIFEGENLAHPRTKDGWLMRGGSIGTPYENHGNLDDDYGGGATFLGRLFGGASNNLVYISGNSGFAYYQDENGNIIDMGPVPPEDILLHELLGHAIPEMIGSDTGNAIENENKAWIEIITKMLRYVDANHEE